MILKTSNASCIHHESDGDATYRRIRKYKVTDIHIFFFLKWFMTRLNSWNWKKSNICMPQHTTTVVAVKWSVN
ncbi:CLUMA_CG000682, isoform A [Clunio marinus]|uniref:CLUMA_CG000682, isoform A n=1 Tax=Clunio marinus TaxID=568069 RepID=A0A1J1HFT3_9DIPT|nr:CLUMA_CG000682, isoform A [Clunio marinus]